MYSNPPLYGARIVTEILSDDKLKRMWTLECAAMAKRIIDMRALLRCELENKQSSRGRDRDWSHITKQIGMFSFLGLEKIEVEKLRSDYHIYCTDDSRISIAGINPENVEYVAGAIIDVTERR